MEESSGAGNWVLGIVMGLLSLFGLIMASQAVDRIIYYVGLLFFVFGVLFVFALIARATGGSRH